MAVFHAQENASSPQAPLSVALSQFAGFRESILYREADPYTNFVNNNSAPVSVATGAQNVQITGMNVAAIGKCVLIETITFGLNNPAVVQLLMPSQAAPAAGATANQGTLQFVNGGTGTIVLPVHQLIRLHGNTSSASNGYGLNVRNNLNAGSVNYIGGIGVSGWRFADDLDFSAPRVAMFVGDSVLNGTGPTATSKMYPFIFKQFLASRGSRVRVVLKSISGSTTANHEQYRAGGWHDISQCDLIVYALGINDAAAAVSGPNYVANLTAFWDWAKVQYPSARMIVLGVTPLENNTTEAAAAAIRTAASDYVASVNSDRLAYIEMSAAFDRTASSNYASSDTPGSRVHPSDAGHSAIATVLQNGFASLSWSI